jgi:hypothetical protein
MTTVAPARSREQRATTIFKRRPTRGYTTVTSDVINDPDLTLDELAALIKLLALPGTWQLHPFEIRKRWAVGREKYYRIMNRLIELRFVIAGEMMRDPDTQAFVGREFMVFDERQPESAGSSSGPLTDDDGAPSIADEMDDEIPESGGGTEADKPVASLPHTGFRHTADPHAGQQHSEVKKDNNNNLPPYPPNPPRPPDDAEARGSPQAPASGATDRRIETDGPLADAAPLPERKDRGPPSLGSRGEGGAKPLAAAPAARPAPGALAQSLAGFLAKYPAEKIMSETRCSRIWLRLSDQDRTDAVDGLEAFLADRARQKIKLPDAGTYLRDRLWKKFVGPGARGKVVELTPDMPNWHRWKEYFEATGSTFRLKFMLSSARDKKPFPAESAWPPSLHQGGTNGSQGA